MVRAALSALLLLAGTAAALDVVVDGHPRVRVETDGSPPARFAADLVRRHVVLMAGAALPQQGANAAVRFERGEQPGYAIAVHEKGALVKGADLARAAFDILAAWGCRFDGAEPEIPRKATLQLAAREWRPRRRLLVESDHFDPSLPAAGVAVRGIERYDPARLHQVRSLGYEIRVASTSFDDFLPPALFRQHPEWFAWRNGARAPRGNFALLNEGARAAYLDRLAAWLEAHPEVDCVGIWPEVTSVWDEDALKNGAAESYALLWRDAAVRFPARRFEVLATGLTLRPPPGRVPKNVEVRLRPGRDASGLQGLEKQPVEAVRKAWEVRGATVVLEIDAAPESWCGMPWPCHDAIRADARRLDAAVLRGGGHLHAALWRDPDMALPADVAELVKRARHVRSWGHPRDAADLFYDERSGIAFRIAAVERVYRIAARKAGDLEERRSAAGDAYLGYWAILRDLQPAARTAFRRYRLRDYRGLLEELLPRGVEHRVGPARVRETFDRLEVETERLRLGIERRTATVVSVHRKLGTEWSPDLTGGDGNYFAVVALASKPDRTDGEVAITSPATGRVRIALSGRFARGGPKWKSVLEFSNASGLVRQAAEVSAPGGIAAGCRWKTGVYDLWVCPPYATEGVLGAGSADLRSLRMPPGTLLYCRRGEHGPGLAARQKGAGLLSLKSSMLVATSRADRIGVDWILFSDTGELGK